MIYNVTPTDTSETGMGGVKNLFQVEKSPKKSQVLWSRV